MDQITLDLIKIGSGIIGGGLAGAILNNYVAKRRSRIQPIAKRVKISNIFIPNNLVEPHITRITFSGAASQDYHFHNLTIAQIEIANTGNTDYKSFSFGLSFNNGTTAINFQGKGLDRHHIINSDPTIDFSNPSEIVDFNLIPFNRKDKYEITLYLTNSQADDIGEINFSSSNPVKFVELDSFKRSFLQIMKESVPMISTSIGTINFK